MATFRIPRLVGKTNKAGITSWYWQPSATLAKAGWEPVSLGKDERAAIEAARTRNDQVEEWKLGGIKPGEVRARAIAGTLNALIARYEREILEGKKSDKVTPLIAASTARVYRVSLRRLAAWAGKHPLAYITRERVRTLRQAMMAPETGIGHHAAHQTLKMGRALFAFAMDCDLVTVNPFVNFKLAAPPPRDVIWSPPARELMVAAANGAGMPSIALAIQLGFAIGQREADILGITIAKYVPIPEHKMQPEDYATLARLAPDGIPRGIRIRQAKTKAWIEVPVTGTVRAQLERNIARAKAGSSTRIILDDTRPGPKDHAGIYHGEAGQTRFQRDFADVREAAIKQAVNDNNPELAAELATLQFRDLRRTCVVYLGELGLDAHLIAAITGHDIDETQRILKTYMPRTTGRAARAIALASVREEKAAKRNEQANG